MDNYKNKDLASIQVGGDKDSRDFRDSQDKDSLKESKHDKREFEFSE